MVAVKSVVIKLNAIMKTGIQPIIHPTMLSGFVAFIIWSGMVVPPVGVSMGSSLRFIKPDAALITGVKAYGGTLKSPTTLTLRQ